jgi:hypothetical protein
MDVLSGDENWESEDSLGDYGSDMEFGEGQYRQRGAFTSTDIQAESQRRKTSKAERLESIMGGRSVRQEKEHNGGSTNRDKLRKKNFLMSKHSFNGVRKLQNEKQTRFNGAGRDPGAKHKKGKKAGTSQRRRR